MLDSETFEGAIRRGDFGNGATLIAAAGFEERCLAAARLLRTHRVRIVNGIVLDYSDKQLNEPRRSELINTVQQVAEVFVLHASDEASFSFASLPLLGEGEIIVDITGLDRMLMFALLDELDRRGTEFHVVYTEAENYFPTRAFYESLTKGGASKETAFSRYLKYEKAEFAYSYDCDLIRPMRFMGDPEPGQPFMLIGFFAFKRSRLQMVLQEIETEKKVFILSVPIRGDFAWRKDCQAIINWDLIENDPDAVQEVPTLYPEQVFEFLEKKCFGSGDHTRFNILLSPLGSKMQTLGCYLFWRAHPTVSVVFAHPRRFFPPSFSDGYRSTFYVCKKRLAKIKAD